MIITVLMYIIVANMAAIHATRVTAAEGYRVYLQHTLIYDWICVNQFMSGWHFVISSLLI